MIFLAVQAFYKQKRLAIIQLNHLNPIGQANKSCNLLYKGRSLGKSLQSLQVTLSQYLNSSSRRHRGVISSLAQTILECQPTCLAFLKIKGRKSKDYKDIQADNQDNYNNFNSNHSNHSNNHKGTRYAIQGEGRTSIKEVTFGKAVIRQHPCLANSMWV